MTNIVDINIPEFLPEEVPLILVRGAILMPKGKIPVPIMDSSTMSLVFDAIKKDRLVGLVQPSGEPTSKEKLRLFKSGTLGYVYDLTEIDEKFVALLYGINRFDIIDEKAAESKTYNMARVDYSRYETDLLEKFDFSFDRERLLKALKQYFNILEVTPDWTEIENTPNDRLITTLAMVCPFEAPERQALLESPTPKQQSELITSLIEMASFDLSSSFPSYLSQEVH